MEKSIDIFVPGRLCLFGEHSDWAGGHRRQNSRLIEGYTIVCQTNQGIYIRAKKLKERRLKMRSTIDDRVFEFDIALEREALREEARKGGLFSYVAGTAYYLVERFNHHNRGGIYLDNFKTTLPIGKGLSSSAAVCVGVVRAFNLLYNVQLTKEGEMELAYRGEVLTPSRCGRMDQACAFDKPVLMKFDGDYLEVEPLEVGENMHMVVVDLKKGKKTKKILTDLNKSYPFAQKAEDKLVQKYLGPNNRDTIGLAMKAISSGDIASVGRYMNEVQRKFDKYLGPRCTELKAPKLHRVLFYKPIQQFIYGGKGVGSQGDGCAQLLAKSKEDQTKVMEILDNSELDVRCYELDIEKS